ncbi:MAG TPA: ankyrin repeat domain-containing protein [Burkholderiales bacterium]|nr:ankyrin repeat domain-containing protein [Burkholderiales bacterium]
MPPLPPAEPEKPVEKAPERTLPKVERHVEKPKPMPKRIEKPVQPEAVQPEENRPAPMVQKYADLATAVSVGDKAAVLQMIRQGEDVNLVKSNQVPLIIAVKNGDIEMVRILLSHGADVNLTDSQGNTAMIYAKVRADAKMIELLKHAGAKNPFN